MRFATALSRTFSTSVALEDCLVVLAVDLMDDPPNVVVVFASHHHAPNAEFLVRLLGEHYPNAARVGCCASGVASTAVEVEEGPVLTVWAGNLGGGRARAFQISTSAMPKPSDPVSGWAAAVGVEADKRPDIIVLADPFSVAVPDLIAGLHAAYPGGAVVGGLASGGAAAGANLLFSQGEVWRSGAVGLALFGGVGVRAVAAPACRPVGSPMFVTALRDNRILTLDGQLPTGSLNARYKELAPYERPQFRTKLHIGLAIADQDAYEIGDFLVRGVFGVERSDGALVISGVPHLYQVVQFHLCDAHAATDAFAARLDEVFETTPSPAGALLFTCVDRGEALYGQAHVEATLIENRFGEMPLAGVFCAGEIGPIARPAAPAAPAYLHTFTAVIAFIVAKPG